MSRLAICADLPSFIREYWGSEGLHNCKQIPYQLSHLQPPETIFYTVPDKDLFKNSSVFKNNYIVYFEKNLQIPVTDFPLLWRPQRAVTMMRSFMMWLLAAYLPPQAPSSVFSTPSGHFP